MPYDSRESEDDFGQSKVPSIPSGKDNLTPLDSTEIGKQFLNESFSKYEQGDKSFIYLGKQGKEGNDFKGLETFDKPAHCSKVTMTSDEVTANCPVTNQPDWYIVKIEYEPDKRCIESKSLKLYLHSFRNVGLFCEAFAEQILIQIQHATGCNFCRVTVTQKPRGGVSIESVSEYFKG